jgi:hypothetical protein
MAMPPFDPPAELGEALELLGRAQMLAVEASPAALDECATALEQACLRLSRPAASEQARRIPSVVLALRRETDRVTALLEQTAAFYGNWIRLRNALTAGYSSSGAPADYAPEPRLRLEA